MKRLFKGIFRLFIIVIVLIAALIIFVEFANSKEADRFIESHKVVEKKEKKEEPIEEKQEIQEMGFISRR